MHLINRSRPGDVALETTLLAHGLPAGEGKPFAAELAGIVSGEGARAAVVGLVEGRAVVGLTEAELDALLADPGLPKLNTANLGLALSRGLSGATTVSTTMELAAAAGLSVFATGGIGGVHRGYGEALDISSDLTALSRFPVAVVSSGVKSILDVASTREALETLGVPVVGWRTDRFPAFYRRDGGVGVDGRFDDISGLARFVAHELARTGRGVLVCSPIPEADEIALEDWSVWLRQAEGEADAVGASGRDRTPAVLAGLHRVSGGATLAANLALVRENARVAARLCAELVRRLGGDRG